MYRLMDTFSSQHQSHESEIFAIFMPFLSQDFTRPGDHDFYFISYTPNFVVYANFNFFYAWMRSLHCTPRRLYTYVLHNKMKQNFDFSLHFRKLKKKVKRPTKYKVDLSLVSLGNI